VNGYILQVMMGIMIVMVYIGSDLYEDKNPMPSVRRLYYDCLG
jgi:hypothetical protein